MLEEQCQHEPDAGESDEVDAAYNRPRGEAGDAEQTWGQQRLPSSACRPLLPAGERDQQQCGDAEHPTQLLYAPAVGVHHGQEHAEHSSAEQQRTDDVQVHAAARTNRAMAGTKRLARSSATRPIGTLT